MFRTFCIATKPLPTLPFFKGEGRVNAIKLRGDIQFFSRALSPNPSPTGRGAGVRV